MSADHEKNKEMSISRKESRRGALTLLAVFMVLILLDQCTKASVVSHLKGKPAVVLLPGIFELDYVENTGMAFGMLKGGTILFVVFSAVFLIVCVWIIARILPYRKLRPAAVCLTVIAAGAAGNMADRMVRGYVIDFFYFVLIRFPVFNVADCLVVGGTIVLSVLILFIYKEEDMKLVL